MEIKVTDESDHLSSLEIWLSQAIQFSRIGTPGITYMRGDLSETLWPGAYAEVLLHRDEGGHLNGILYYYPKKVMFEQPGNVNLFVAPGKRRGGIGSALIREAIKRWKIDPYKQHYTNSGKALVESLLD